MIRTQISMSPEEYKLAKVSAKKLGISLASFLRLSLRTLFHSDSTKPWMKHCGLIATGDSCSSQTIDEIVYGQKE